MTENINKKEEGVEAEKLAEKFLKKSGYRIVDKNFNSHYGEIDIVGIEKNFIAFIEVKMRRSNKFGNILYSIDKKKQERIIKTAKLFLAQYKEKFKKYDIRFDAVMIRYFNKTNYKIELIKNAFVADTL